MATVNYSFNLPTVGGDDDVWGDLLNANWTALDAQLFSGTIGADTTGNAATATLATLATDATTLASPRDFTIGATTRNFDGSANVTWSLGDIGIASQEQAEAGADDTKVMTPLRTAQAQNARYATTAEIQGLSGTNKIPTTAGIATAAALAAPSGASDWTPDWSAFISADWVITANRTLGNPTNVVAGTTRVVRIAGNDGTGRTISFGANFKGDLNGGPVTSAAPILYMLYAATTTEIWVSALEFS